MVRRRSPAPVVAHDNGTFSLNLDTDVREAMLGYLDQLDELITASHDDARLTRLHPPAYSIDSPGSSHDDNTHNSTKNAERNDEWQTFMRDELIASRRASLESARAILRALEPVDEAVLHSFAMTLNSLRLVLGTMLGIDTDDHADDEDEAFAEDDDHTAAQYALYEFCGWLLEWTVDALAGELPDS